MLEIQGIPLIIHVYKRTKLSKLLDEVVICCDDKKILDVAKRFNANAILTSKNHTNGTERIYEAFKKLKKYDLIIDVQGDEPLINPKHIDQVINFHKKNFEIDIVLPHLKITHGDNNNIVKLITNLHDEVLYLSRARLPLEFKKNSTFKKHLSVISFYHLH